MVTSLKETHNSRANVDTLAPGAAFVYCLLATWNNQQVSLRSLRSTIWSNGEALALWQSAKLRPEHGVDETTHEPVISLNHMDVPDNSGSSADSRHLLGKIFSR